MGIFVLIASCLFTVVSFMFLLSEIVDEDLSGVIVGVVLTVIGVIAIVFQSIAL